jgi:hypothetical protein
MELQNTNSKIQITKDKESNSEKQDSKFEPKKIPKPSLNIV